MPSASPGLYLVGYGLAALAGARHSNANAWAGIEHGGLPLTLHRGGGRIGVMRTAYQTALYANLRGALLPATLRCCLMLLTRISACRYTLHWPLCHVLLPCALRGEKAARHQFWRILCLVLARMQRRCNRAFGRVVWSFLGSA